MSRPSPYYLPPIQTQFEVERIPDQPTVVTNPTVPGLEMTIPAGADLRNRDGSPVARVSITPLPPDRTPAPLPPNTLTTMVYSSQPGGGGIGHRAADRVSQPGQGRPRHPARDVHLQP